MKPFNFLLRISHCISCTPYGVLELFSKCSSQVLGPVRSMQGNDPFSIFINDWGNSSGCRQLDTRIVIIRGDGGSESTERVEDPNCGAEKGNTQRSRWLCYGRIGKTYDWTSDVDQDAAARRASGHACLILERWMLLKRLRRILCR